MGRMNVLDPEKIKEQILALGKNPPIYAIGIDCTDRNIAAYCLTKIHNGEIEIILCKSGRNNKEFLMEIRNLTKYFDAKQLIQEAK